MSKRKVDQNGYVRIEGNPISKVGIFDYLGASLGPDYEPETVYKVFRPESSLNNEETINSFKSIPWIDDHSMLGSENLGLTPAEQKGVHGTTGDDVYFEYPYLKANLNIYSEYLGDIIESGKKELSPGYRCIYLREGGAFNGEHYEVIQTKILGNHLATVQEGRTGPDVAVMDHTFSLDGKDFIMDKPVDKKDEKEKKAEDAEVTMSDIMDMMKDMKAMMPKGKKAEDEFPDKGKEKKDDDKAEDADKDDDKGKGMDSNDISTMIDKKLQTALDAALKPVLDKLNGIESKAMDSALVESKSKLVAKISARIGTFDHAEKTLEEIQDYGLNAFGLDCSESSQKAATLNGFLAANHSPESFATGLDSKVAGSGWSQKRNQGAK